MYILTQRTLAFNLALVCLQVFYLPAMCTSKVTYQDLGQTITRITSTQDFFDLYVGGTNFLAHLTPDLQVLFNFTLGPVTESRYCAPLAAPCDNTVTVLQVDHAHGMLLVCGTAYQGTCTLHTLLDIHVWYCLRPEVSTSLADVVSGESSHSTLVHFVQPTPMKPARFNGAGSPVFDPSDCRAANFGGMFMDNEGNDTIVNSSGNEAITRQARSKRSPVEQKEEVTFQSNLVIAGSPGGSTTSSFLSLRHVTFVSGQYTIGYSLDQSGLPAGLFLREPVNKSFVPIPKLSFTWANDSYLVFLQESSTCEEVRGPCLVTRVARTCQSSAAVLNYVETPIACKDSKNKLKHKLLISARLGTVGLQQINSYVTVPILVMAFGNGSSPMDKTADPKYGTAVCAISLDQLNREFEFVLQSCATGNSYDSKPVHWINGSNISCQKENSVGETCDLQTKNRFVQSTGFYEMSSETFLRLVTVETILSNTHTFKYVTGEILPIEKMEVFLLTNEGNIKKFSLEAKKVGNLFEVSSPSPLSDSFALDGVVLSHLEGITDHSKAVMYIASGRKIIELDLESCLQYQTCGKCRQESSKCRWCPFEQKCREATLALSICQISLTTYCPPEIQSFQPSKVPTKGGSNLTLTGSHLGWSGHGPVNVTVCGQPCQDVWAQDSNLTCKVPGVQSATKCNITVSVQQRDSQGNTSTFLMPHLPTFEYVVPNITTFKPKHGPAYGGTVLLLLGQNILVGSNRSVTVGGSRCEVIQDSTSFFCRIAGNKNRQPHYANVTVYIDNYHSTLENEKFHFCNNPSITKLHPLKTIASGGIYITVEGSNLNCVATPLFKMFMPFLNPGSNVTTTSSFTELCLVATGNRKMTCKTADVRKLFDTQPVSVRMSVDMDGTDLVPQLTGTGEITIEPDPTDLRLVDTIIVGRQKPLIIRGRSIPSWLDLSQIIVMVGNITVSILSISSTHITCDLSYIVQKHPLLIPTDLAENVSSQSLETNMMQMTTQVPTGRERVEVQAVTAAPATSTRSRTNNRITFKTTVPSTPDTSTGRNTTGTTSITSTTTKISTTERVEFFEYSVSIKIGNFQRDLGSINITLSLNMNDINKTTDTNQPIRSRFDQTVLAAGASCAGLLLLVLGVVSYAMFLRARRAQALVKEQAQYMSSLSGSQHGSREAALPSLKQILETVVETSQRADLDKLIFELDCLTIGKSIGTGNFGCVFEGYLSKNKESPGQKVAVKTLQDPSSHNLDLQGFVQEALIMREFDHPNVLGLIGLAEKQPGIPYVILPFMENGDLLTFIRDPTVTLSLHDVIKFGADIAKGMAYLSDLKFVHRDLAARNCMLDDSFHVKVADFGLCRDIYEKGYYTSDNRKKLPIRWMAVESIERGAYSSKSDVWSLGVVLWELLTRGVTPYPGVNGWDVVNFLRHRRLAPPYFCPDKLFDLMMKCWAKEPNLRPDFTDIQTQLLQMIGQSPPVLADTIRRRRGETLPYVNSSDTQGVLSAATHNYSNVPSVKQQQPIENNPSLNSSGAKKNSYTNIAPLDLLVPNVLIAMPLCYSHRDVSKQAVGIYIHLVDNYEPPPKFSSQFMRSTSKQKSKKRDRHTHRLQNGESLQVEESTSGYFFPLEYRSKKSYAKDRIKTGSDPPSRESQGSNMARDVKDNYYELETTSLRVSADSEKSSRWSTLNQTGSVPSIINITGSFPSIAECDVSGRSTSTGHTSADSTLSVPQRHSQLRTLPQVTSMSRVSPLAKPRIYSSLNKHDPPYENTVNVQSLNTEMLTEL